MGIFKIFYSWQSDLPGNTTRNFIRECIDEAIDLAQESDADDAVRDEATLGTTGSPNIVTTLFSKIDNCDLFIADLSLCFTEECKKEKKSPNPNVLLELGYAVKTLGWNRVLCLCNTDYGKNYPFDVAHNRITDFSLEGKRKKEVKNEIAKIIFTNIRDLRKQIPRAKDGMASHIVGTYNFENQKVINALVPIEINKQESYVLHNEELLFDAKELINEIQKITNRIKSTINENNDPQAQIPKQPTPPIKIHSNFPKAVYATAEHSKSPKTPMIWESLEEDKERIKRWTGIDVTEDFFDLGGLNQGKQLLDIFGSSLNGSDDEKSKYEKLEMLSNKLLLLDVRTFYLKTFEGICFIPLAIQNISSIHDTNISVAVTVEIGEIIEPDENLIFEDIEGFQGLLCRDDNYKTDVGIICELFSLTEDGNIHVEYIPYDPLRYIPKPPTLTSKGLKPPGKNKEDYKQELKEFIASAGGSKYYEFSVASLRPGECRWLCCGMLIRPLDGKIKVNYQICSKCSSGELSGTLEIT